MALIVPTWWQGECCYRVCVVNPQTTDEMLAALLDDMASFGRPDRRTDALAAVLRGFRGHFWP